MENLRTHFGGILEHLGLLLEGIEFLHSSQRRSKRYSLIKRNSVVQCRSLHDSGHQKLLEVSSATTATTRYAIAIIFCSSTVMLTACLFQCTVSSRSLQARGITNTDNLLLLPLVEAVRRVATFRQCSSSCNFERSCQFLNFFPQDESKDSLRDHDRDLLQSKMYCFQISFSYFPKNS